MYVIQFTNSAKRVFKKLPLKVQQHLKIQIQSLLKNPLKGEQLKGVYRNFRSLHLSYKGVSYRVIYQLFPSLNYIVIYLADKRENIYKRLTEMRV